MTPDDTTMSRVVAAHFGLWTPRYCHGTTLAILGECHGAAQHNAHEIPCPDLTQPEWFVRLLKALPIGIELYNRTLTLGSRSAKQWVVDYFERRICVADTPEEALLLGAYQLIQQEVAK